MKIEDLGLIKIGQGNDQGTDNTSGKTKYKCAGCGVQAFLSDGELRPWINRHSEIANCSMGLS